MGRYFMELLRERWKQGKFVCVGLDSELAKIPRTVVREWMELHGHACQSESDFLVGFNEAIITTTHDVACAYKLNVAFYEAHGAEGWMALKRTMRILRRGAPEVPIILDAKRADIGNTNEGYVSMAFDELGADAITVHPYLGREALEPFLKREDKGIIVLCRTSNKGAGEFQDLLVNGVPLYLEVAQRVVSKWNARQNCCLVVGATYPHELKRVREIAPDLPFLIPGIGAQGGDLKATVHAGKDARGEGMIINASRGIIFASPEEDFASAARCELLKLDTQIRQHLKEGR